MIASPSSRILEMYSDVELNQMQQDAWVLRWLDPARTNLPEVSFIVGIFGITVAWLIAVGLAASIIFFVDDQFWILATDQAQFTVVLTTLGPVVILAILATMTPLFWHGSIAVRFYVICILYLPVLFAPLLFASVMGFLWMVNFNFNRNYELFLAAMGYFSAAGCTAFTIQMLTHWRFSHLRREKDPIVSLKIWTIIELTVVAAIGFMLVRSIIKIDWLDTVFGSLVAGGVASIAFFVVGIITIRRSRKWLGRCVKISFAGSFVFVLIYALFNSQILVIDAFLFAEPIQSAVEFTYTVAIFVAIATVSSIVNAAALASGVFWLRGCGWTWLHNVSDPLVIIVTESSIVKTNNPGQGKK